MRTSSAVDHFRGGIPVKVTFGSTALGGEAPAAAVSARPIVVATLMRNRGATGVQTHIREVTKYFTSKGNPPLIVTPMSWSGPLSLASSAPRLVLDRLSGAAGVAWYRFWHFHLLRRNLKRSLAEVAEDAVVYAQCPLSARAALETRRGFRQRVVMVVHFDGSQADEWVDAGKIRRGGLTYRAIRRTEQRVIPMLDGIVYVSEASKVALEHNVYAAHVPSEVIHSFISRPPAVEEPTPGNDLSADLVTVGGPFQVKNQGFLLEVLAQANRLGYRWTLDVLGDGPVAKSLELSARSLGVHDQVRFLDHREDLRAFLPRHRVYVHAATHESLSIAIIEAMAAGLPVVAPEIGGFRELFQPGVQGIFWPLGQPEPAARMLVELLEDASTMAQMSRAARDRFSQGFDSAVIGPLLESFLTAEVPRRPVAILICFSCGPGAGSERGVGWTWAKAASELAEVILITEPTHRAEIEAAIAELGLRISVRWVDPPAWISRLMPARIVGFGPRYCAWQVMAGRLIRGIERRQSIDIVHHVTWASDSLPSALLASRAPIRVWGPVGGATRTAWGLYRYLTPWGKTREIFRDITNGMLRTTTGTWLARHATLVVALNKDVQARWSAGPTPVVVASNTAVDNSELAPAAVSDPLPEAQPFRTALFVGRLIHWKGLLLAVRSLQYAPGWRLVVLGDGPDKKRATELAERMGLRDRLEFRGNVPRANVLGAFRSADALLFPSFHDSSSWAVGEATSMGCPVVCLDAGGPALQAGSNAHVVTISPARTLPLRIGATLEGLCGRGEPDDIWRYDRISGLLRTWYRGSGVESAAPGENGPPTERHRAVTARSRRG